MDLAEEFTALIIGLQAANIEFAVCGGVAMGLHGFPRFTKDIDFLMQPGDLSRVLAVAKNCGFEDQVVSMSLGQAERACEIRRLNKFQGEDHLMLDLLLVVPSLQDVWSGKVPFAWRGLTVFAVSAAGLAKMKRLAARPQDLLDIETLGFKPDDPAIQP